ncbi:putative dehydrogenase [Catenuloplanes nepalensis]|uniref:Dehydrogenase n=1 Tax=Catenuloplanes nepalensis TaxID=587533 RepID=A0ABT9MTN6_9ACTN|nr:Gfo/Idh/MocA family oxidoreductase [Catenuloplanes nepalensis]MDP9794789.1 putative dehydrogenase [Catenuloplanes nepalensis]
MSPVTIALVGAGHRGQKYAEWIAGNPDRARLVAVADPLPQRRERAGGTPYPGWEQLIEKGRVADAVIIATQDRDHLGPAEAFALAGYHVLLEKPLAPTADECRRIVAAVEDAGDPAHIRSGPAESLAAHLAVFAAEQARHTGTVVTVPAA